MVGPAAGVEARCCDPVAEAGAGCWGLPVRLGSLISLETLYYFRF